MSEFEPSTEGAAEDVQTWRRLHPATIFIDFARRLWSAGYVFALALITWIWRGEASVFLNMVIGGLVLFGVFGAVLRYAVLRYGIAQERLVIHSGLLNRQVRTIPIERIQNIDLKRGILHRMFDVVDVSIETAGGTTPEAQLSVLGRRDAERLKAELLRQQREEGVAPADTADAPEDNIIWRASLKHLIIAGATENRAGWIIGGIFGLWYTANELVGFESDALYRWLADVFGASVERLQDAGVTILVVLAALAITGLLVAGWIVSIVYTLVRYYDFRLRGEGPRLRRQYGLFTQVENVVPLRRVQILRLESPLPRRLLGYFSIQMETAGSVVDQKGATSTPLCPIIEEANAPGICRRVFEQLDLSAAAWKRVSRLTIRRGFVRYALFGTALVALLAWWVDVYFWVLLPVVLVLALIAARWRYEVLGYAEQDDFLLARAGVWTRKIWVLPKGKIQSVHATQSPLQRRLDLANLDIRTAGSRALSGAEIIDLPKDVAFLLEDRLSHASNVRVSSLVDAV